MTLRFGIMSVASINEYGFLPAVRFTHGVEVAAVASRDGDKARAYARDNGIPAAHGGYDALLADPGVDCVYIPLPNGLHREWALKALAAGKHVLCEKPVAADAAQAREIAHAVQDSGLTFMEGFHFRYHPLAKRLEEIVRGGEIGEVRDITVGFCERIADPRAVQYRPELAGGALMDVGCYCVNFARWMAGADTARVLRAHARMAPSGVDESLRAVLEFPDGATARISCSIAYTLPEHAVVRGARGALAVLWPFSAAKAAGGRLARQYRCLVRRGLSVRTLEVPLRLSYACQLAAFRDAVLSGTEPVTGIRDALANMRLMDAIFEKSGIHRPV